MTYQDEQQLSLKRRGSKKAIALAMQGLWKEAIVANRSLIENFPNDVDAYNRLGRAYLELGEYNQSREAYNKTVELDPYNTIAQKNLNRLSHLGENKENLESEFHKVEPWHFIEETGKTGVVNLYHLAPGETLAEIVAGDMVHLKIEGASLIAQDDHGVYLGKVETKYGQRLIKLMKGGNRYTANVIRSTEEMMTLIIREVYQDPSQVGQFSFPSKRFERVRFYNGDRVLRRELENDEGGDSYSGYTIVGGGEVELFTEDSSDISDQDDEDE